ncbi:MAG: carboxymuconolactone decarboxylase family protein [Dehalococcoidia bacterium]|nr:carboxymuconolactone decarboxylase family protein [Dehalococcoidia bacterium]
MSRLAPKSRDELTPAQQEQYDRIGRFRPPGPDGALGGPFDPWVRSPELAQRAVSFGNFIWERTTLERRIVEFAICVTARFWRSNVEWVAHARVALQQGVSQATLDDVMAERRPAGAPADEQLAYEICQSLHATHGLPEELYARAVAGFGEQGLVEIIATIGYYTMVAMTLNAFEVQAPGDRQPFDR